MSGMNASLAIAAVVLVAPGLAIWRAAVPC
jgi:hypothetical protein